MRAVELAKVAASAEALRLRRMARRNAIQVAFWAAAGVFAVAVFVLLHVVAYHLMVPRLTPTQASLVVLAVDLVAAGAFAFLARRDVPDPVEAEAHQIRQQALVEMRSSLTLAAMAGSAASLVLGRRRGRSDVTVVGKRGTMRLVGELAARLLARR